jgi:hypothetical protein
MRYKVFSFLLFVFSLGFTLHGQERATPDPEIRKLKIEFVTNQMSLSQAQMQHFLPLFNRYLDELLYQRKAIKALDKNNNSQYVIEQRQKIEEKMVEIKGRYKNDFLKIISAQQLAAMYKGEGEFKAYLLEHLKNRKK